MRTRVLGLGIALFGVLLLGLHFSIKKQADPAEIEEYAQQMRAPRLWPGRVAPDFDLDTLEGGRFRLSEAIGKKVVLLNFFATWCEPCRSEIPELKRFSDSVQKEPFVIVFVDAGEEAPPVRKFVSDFGLASPVGIDHARKIQRLYGVTAYPTNVLIGADGRVQFYEATAIRNADVTLRPTVTAQLTLVRDGKGITPEAYAAAAAGENYRAVLPPREHEAATLTGRALSIAQKMDCLCGCSKKVAACGCNNAGKVKKELKKFEFAEKTDADVMREMGKQFCMESM
jgi:thiol-disulfide isomerase/thioredoxin